jgi:hypothetical protein
MLFGLSALFLLIFQNHEKYLLNPWLTFLGPRLYCRSAWLLQLGTAPTKLYKSRVSNDVIFEYPMVLGPALVVSTLATHMERHFIAWALTLHMQQRSSSWVGSNGCIYFQISNWFHSLKVSKQVYIVSFPSLLLVLFFTTAVTAASKRELLCCAFVLAGSR